ncbi:hypothetical protein JCM11641_004578 [Rhodosporidiobolus odoratus]
MPPHTRSAEALLKSPPMSINAAYIKMDEFEQRVLDINSTSQPPPGFGLVETTPIKAMRYIIHHNLSLREKLMSAVMRNYQEASSASVTTACRPSRYAGIFTPLPANELPAVKTEFERIATSHALGHLLERHRVLIDHYINIEANLAGQSEADFLSRVDAAFEIKHSRLQEMLGFAFHSLASAAQGSMAETPQLLVSLLYTRLGVLPISTQSDNEQSPVATRSVAYAEALVAAAQTLKIDREKLATIEDDLDEFRHVLTIVWANMLRSGTYPKSLNTFMTNLAGTWLAHRRHRLADKQEGATWSADDQDWLANLVFQQYNAPARPNHFKSVLASLMMLATSPQGITGKQLDQNLLVRTSASIQAEMKVKRVTIYALRFLKVIFIHGVPLSFAFSEKVSQHLAEVGITDDTTFDEALEIVKTDFQDAYDRKMLDEYIGEVSEKAEEGVGDAEMDEGRARESGAGDEDGGEEDEEEREGMDQLEENEGAEAEWAGDEEDEEEEMEDEPIWIAGTPALVKGVLSGEVSFLKRQFHFKVKGSTYTKILNNPYALHNGLAVVHNTAVAPHFDRQDPKNSWGFMSPYGTFTGGKLVLPQFGVRVSYRAGDVVMLRARLVKHYVEPFHGDRHSVVFFWREWLLNYLEYGTDWEALKQGGAVRYGSSKEVAMRKRQGLTDEGRRLRAESDQVRLGGIDPRTGTFNWRF